MATYFAECSKTKLFFSGNPTIDIVICIINIFTALTATVLNFLVIISIWRTPSLHTPSNVLVASLALCDFCIGLVVQPMFVASSIFKIKLLQDMFCSSTLVRGIPFFFLTAVSLITLTAISLDRYIAIKLHLRYRQIVTVKRVTALLVLVWLVYSFAALTVLWADVTFIDHVSPPAFIINVTATGFTYIMIYRVVRRHKAQIRTQLQVQQWQHAGAMPHLMKSSWSMFLVSFTFALCCLPYIVVTLVKKTTGQSSLKGSLFEVTVLIVLINSTVNPALYCWRFKQIRAAVIRNAKHILRRSSNE